MGGVGVRLRALFLALVEDMLRPWTGSLGIVLRRGYYRRRLRRCGKDLRIGPGVYLEGAQFMSFGDHVHLDKGVIVTAGPLQPGSKVRTVQNAACKAELGEVILGDRCHIAVGCVIQGHGGVSIGRSFTASAHALIYSESNSPYGNRDGQVVLPDYDVARVVTPVAIGDNVWVGLSSVVIGNAVGNDAFIKPLSLVISNVPPNTIVSGVPARPEGQRFRDI